MGHVYSGLKMGMHSHTSQPAYCGRREFVKGFATLAASAALLAYDTSTVAAQQPPETTSLRLVLSPAICFAPAYVADSFLKAEGFTDVKYVATDDRPPLDMLASGEADFSLDAARSIITSLHGGLPLVVLAGI